MLVQGATGRLLAVSLFVSLLSHFWLIHLFYLHLLYQPYVGLCQATCVQSHQRQPTSAVAIATCEVQVSGADSHTVPTVATGVSKPLCCRLTLTFTLTSDNLSLYITITFTGHYTVSAIEWIEIHPLALTFSYMLLCLSLSMPHWTSTPIGLIKRWIHVCYIIGQDVLKVINNPQFPCALINGCN